MRFKKQNYIWVLSNAVFVNEGGENIFLETGKKVPLDKIPTQIIEHWLKQGVIKEEKDGINEAD